MARRLPFLLGTALYVFLLLDIFRRVDAVSHSASDTFIAFLFPFLALTGLYLLVVNRAEN